MRIQTFALAALLAVVALPSLVVPASAGGGTLWVDDDGHAGSGCGGSGFAYKNPQKAIDHAAPGQTVKICGGTYTVKDLLIPADKDGLILTGVGQWDAHLVASSAASLILSIEANFAVVETLDFVAPAAAPCNKLDRAILVDGASNVVIANVHVHASASGDSLGACGMQVGIDVSGGSAVVTQSIVEDFQGAGIAYQNSDGKIDTNIVRWKHANSPPPLAAARRQSLGRVGPAGGPPEQGIGIFNGSNVAVTYNSIESSKRWNHQAGQLASGIAIAGEGTRAKLRHNTIRRADLGIFLSHEATGTAKDNDVRKGNGIGIYVYFDGAYKVLGNTVKSQAGGGIWVDINISGATITDNDFRNNAGADCKDDSTGSGTAGTANTWTDNLGLDADPAGICSAP